MRSIVAKCIRGCDVCSAHKASQDRPTDEMVFHSKVNTPWEAISTDLIGLLPRSEHRDSFVLVVTDYLSEFCLSFPLRKVNAEAVVCNIEKHIFLVFGVPKFIICDSGVQYRSKEFLRLTERYHCRINFEPNYNPRANPTERVNESVEEMLAMYCSENHRCWDENLDKIDCAIRTSKHEVTKVTPFFMNFGRNMALSGSGL
ncbi:hypothetical protein JTB14_034670 [Gonioctena quinquepunctata]|nr:hypothetical protein JTB14_034670 [Gonioctena quinquepunctata]